MGAGESLQSSLWESKFQLESKNSKVGIIRLTDKQTQDAYICRKISTLDKRQIQEMERLIDIKLSVQSPFVTKLERAETEKHQQYCAYGKKYFVLFKQPYQTLKQQTLNRKFKNSFYSEEELDLMLQIGIKALFYLKNIDHPHENISSTAFFLNQNRSLIMGDPWLFPKENGPQITRNGFVYPSPEMIRLQNNEINSINLHLSDLFTFGLVLLQVFFMKNMDCVFERFFERVNYDAIWAKLNQIKNQQLRKKLFILLDHEPKNRQTIYRYYSKPISSSELFNRIQKEKFKQNIDRYNLATSEVTEWKNQMPIETALKSSDGKKTFSVSTAQNIFNDDKGYNYYQKEYGQYQKVKPNVPTNNEIHQLNNRSSRANSHNPYEYNNFSSNNNYQIQFNQNHGLANLNQYAPSSSNSFKTGNSQVASNKNFNSSSNFNFNYRFDRNEVTPKPYSTNSSSNMLNFQNNSFYQAQNGYEPSQSQSFSKKYTVNLNTTTYPISNQSYQRKPHESLDQTPSYIPLNNNFTSELKIPPPLHSFTSSNTLSARDFIYRPKSNTNVGGISMLHNETYSLLFPSLILNNNQVGSEVFHMSKGLQEHNSAQKAVSPLSQTSILNQSQAKPSNQPEEVPLVLQKPPLKQLSLQEHNQLQPQNTEQKLETVETPSKQKIKHISLDYNKFHHLSTINERSEMTESFVSQKDYHQDKRSEILIQQDHENHLQQIEKEFLSEQQANQPINVLQQNKIWSIVYPSGTKYIGQIKSDKRNGLGTFFYIDGSKYHGHWLDNKMNGQGTLYYPNGKIAYEGNWKMDNFHGEGKVFNDQIANFEGKYHYEDCTDIDNYWLQYDGQLFEDRKEGKGVLKIVNGEYFDGFFKNDELHGPSKFFTLNSTIIQGLWENNKLIKILSESPRSPSRLSQQKK